MNTNLTLGPGLNVAMLYATATLRYLSLYLEHLEHWVGHLVLAEHLYRRLRARIRVKRTRF